MNIMDMKNKIQSPEYDFLRTDSRLNDSIMLLTTGGSYAYGTNISTSDHVSDFDVRGIYSNPAREILTMNYQDKPYENRVLDVTIYPLVQIITLLTNCNPNTIEILGTKEEHIFMINKYGEMLRENIDLFLSLRAYGSFGGYAIQQLRRLQNALARDRYPQKEKEKHILGSITKQMMTFTDRYKEVTGDTLKLYIDKSEKEEFEDEIFIDLNLSHYPLRDLKGMYSEMSQVVKDYEHLNHRNNKKDETHLLKHSMHLIRLLIMGTEILEGKGINTYRENDREFLLDIRNGKYSYEQIFEIADEYDKKFQYAKENTVLPLQPDYKRINELLMEMNLDIIRNYK